jgi:hypothetical protein
LEIALNYRQKKIMLEHPNPITVSGAFTGLWIRSARINIGGPIIVSSVHFNGAQILGDDTNSVHPAATVTAINDAIVAEVTRLTGRTGLKVVSVNAPSPNKPICVVCSFDAGSPHIIRSAYALAATDASFAAAFTDVMTQIGNLL